MKMFESKIEEYPTLKTYNFMAQGLKIPNMSSIEKKTLLTFHSNKENIEKTIDMLLKKSKKNVSKKTIFFDKISSSFMNFLILVNEALSFLEKKSNNIIYQLQVINSKIKKNEIYSYTGFDAILKSIEIELEPIENTFQINETKLEKVNELYVLLKRTLEKSIDILDNEYIKN